MVSPGRSAWWGGEMSRSINSRLAILPAGSVANNSKATKPRLPLFVTLTIGLGITLAPI